MSQKESHATLDSAAVNVNVVVVVADVVVVTVRVMHEQCDQMLE